MRKKSLAVIVTVLNEAKTIIDLVEAIEKQTLQPDRLIIVDGGSTDETVHLIEQCAKKSSLPIFLASRLGNRSVGRNYAVNIAKTDLLAITDAGCMPEHDWLLQLVSTYDQTESPVIAGFYRLTPKATSFQQAAAPFFLVMPDKVNPNSFLPATRSMLIESEVFKSLGGFNEALSDNEDYAFAKKIAGNKIAISFCREAVVDWQSPLTLTQFYRTIFRFARGDIQARIYRPKVGMLFARYVLGVILVLLIGSQSLPAATLFVLVVFTAYALWSVIKLNKYVKNGKSLLPLLQITADIAVMHGSCAGFLMPR